MNGLNKVFLTAITTTKPGAPKEGLKIKPE